MQWGGVIPFCAPENGGLHKIVQPFLWVMYHFVQSTFLSTSNQISDITIQYKEAVRLESAQEIGCELLKTLSILRKKAESVHIQILAHARQGKLWDVTKNILSYCQQ